MNGQLCGPSKVACLGTEGAEQWIDEETAVTEEESFLLQRYAPGPT